MRLGADAVTAADTTAATSNPSSVEVRPVRDADVLPLIKLEPTPEQKKFVASNAVSLAQAAYKTSGRPFGVFADGEPVGFLLLWDARQDPEEPTDELYVWRLMVDAKRQGRGHGSAAMRWVIGEARRIGVAQVGLSHVPENSVGAFYERFGFHYTGKVHEGEREMVLQLKDAA
ncbi:MAG: GNAT family N-acetyltransferase [Rhizobacter sp.]|nr:GNAT family N-acetyltransferase [Rhizobacter sp.]